MKDSADQRMNPTAFHVKTGLSLRSLASKHSWGPGDIMSRLPYNHCKNPILSQSSGPLHPPFLRPPTTHTPHSLSHGRTLQPPCPPHSQWALGHPVLYSGCCSRADVPSALLKRACSPLSWILGCRWLVFQFSGFASRKDFWCDFIY